MRGVSVPFRVPLRREPEPFLRHSEAISIDENSRAADTVALAPVLINPSRNRAVKRNWPPVESCDDLCTNVSVCGFSHFRLEAPSRDVHSVVVCSRREPWRSASWPPRSAYNMGFPELVQSVSDICRT